MNSGTWTAVFPWPIIGIHAILTPDGKVLTFGTDQAGQQGGQHIYDVWDIATNTHTTLHHRTPTDIFCSVAVPIPGTTQILIGGGDARPLGKVNLGVADVNFYDWTDQSLDPSPTGDMAFARWYPTAFTLSNGKVLMLGGTDHAGRGVGLPELYTPGVGWKTLTGAQSDTIAGAAFYPRAWVASSGKVVILDGGQVMTMDPSGNGTIVKQGAIPFRTDWTFGTAMFAEDKVLMTDSQGGAWVVDISGDKPQFQATESLGAPRIWSNMVVLADGSVMLSGGGSTYDSLATAINTVHIWNPNTGQWFTDDSAAVARLYHSTTLLLPDGTVLSLGGGAPGPLTNLNGEIYKPGYLFDADGSLAERPVITIAPTDLAQGEDFKIAVDDASAIQKLMFIKYGSVTHSFNMEQRTVELAFTVGPNNVLSAQLPDNSNVITPGNWMLFAVNKDGTPSIAATIEVEKGGELFLPSLGSYGTLSGAAGYDETSGVFTLTPDASNAVGALMTNSRIDISYNFTISFDVFLGANDAGGEGMAFVLHNDRSGSDAMGQGGAGLGARGIANGLGIEFDTFRSAKDPKQDHVQIFDTDGSTKKQVKAVAVADMEDGNWHSVVVTWDAATQTLWYSFDGKQMTLKSDLAKAYLGGSTFAHFGFTAATSAIGNEQKVRINSVDARLEDHPELDCCAFNVAHAAEFVTLSKGARIDRDTNIVTLTPGSKNAIGGVMSNVRLDLGHDFQISFDVLLGSNDKGGEGVAFVLHNDPSGAKAIGKSGAGLGAYGLKKGLGIEFDTAFTKGAYGDLVTDHTTIFDTDAPIARSRVTGPVDIGNIEDGGWHKVTVAWDASEKHLTYEVDGVVVGELSQDLATAYFGGSDAVYFGFTGANGKVGNLQQVRITEVFGTFEDDPHHHHGDDSVDLHHITDYVSVNQNAHYDAAKGVFSLMPDAGPAAIMSNARIDLTHDFNLTFTVYLGADDASGDGFAFVLHNDPRGADAIGNAGNSLGALGIKNGLAFAFDINGGTANDHTMLRGTDDNFQFADQFFAPVDLGNLEDGLWHMVEVSWNAALHTLSYSIDCDDAIGATIDLSQHYFGGSDQVYFGFTGAADGALNPYQLRITSMSAIFEA